MKKNRGCRRAIAILVVAVGCAEPMLREPAVPATGVPLEQLNQQSFHSVDAVVFKAVIEDLLRSAEFHTFPSWATKPKVVVWESTEGLSHFITTGQMLPELADRPPVPVELYNALKTRNSHKTTIGPIDSPRVQRASPGRISKRGSGFVEEFEQLFPEARAYLQPWLPAYSADGTSALVRFSFGPTAHGACGTYSLAKSGDAWKIRWSKLSFYA